MNFSKTGYLKSGHRRFDSLTMSLGILGVLFALAQATHSFSYARILDGKSLSFVFVGTVSVLFLQYDLRSLLVAGRLLISSLLGVRARELRKYSALLTQFVERDEDLLSLEPVSALTGDIPGDVRHLFDKGLPFEEIEEILSSALIAEAGLMRTSAEIFARASQLAPALGLLGTVIGLVGVLSSLGSPQDIGPSMSLALMTTAYGSAFGSLVFGPLAGRLDAHSQSTLLVGQEILRKARILTIRAEMRMDSKQGGLK